MVHLVKLIFCKRNSIYFEELIYILLIRMACAFCYYGLVLMTTELFETSTENCWSNKDSMQTLDTCAADCKQLQTTDYMDLLWTTLAEFPGMFRTRNSNFLLTKERILF